MMIRMVVVLVITLMIMALAKISQATTAHQRLLPPTMVTTTTAILTILVMTMMRVVMFLMMVMITIALMVMMMNVFGSFDGGLVGETPYSILYSRTNEDATVHASRIWATSVERWRADTNQTTIVQGINYARTRPSKAPIGMDMFLFFHTVVCLFDVK